MYSALKYSEQRARKSKTGCGRALLVRSGCGFLWESSRSQKISKNIVIIITDLIFLTKFTWHSYSLSG